MNAENNPSCIDPISLSELVDANYKNVSLGSVNNHELRMSVMTEQFGWHSHPSSDEMFMAIEGGLIVEFADREILLSPGQITIVPAGILHRTRPAGIRSVNLTFERRDSETVFID